MERRIVSGILLTLVLTGTLNVATIVAPVLGIRPRAIRLGVWLPRYLGDLPPYEDLLASGIQAIDETVLNETTLQNFDVIYIGRGGFYIHTGEGEIDPKAVKTWVSNGGGILGESEAVIYDSVVTLGTDWSPQLSEIFGVWSTEPDGLDAAVWNTTITITDPSHPITADLPSNFSTTVYSAELYAYVDTGRNPTAKEILTATSYSGGELYDMPIIAAEYGNGKAVYFPYCPDGYTDWGSPGGLNLEKLFINAVKWAASFPTVLIYADKYIYSAGDTMYLGLDIANPDGPLNVCFAIWVVRPGGSIYLYMHMHDIVLPADFSYSNPAFRVITLPNLAPGIYTWHAALLDPATHTIIVEDTAEWDFV